MVIRRKYCEVAGTLRDVGWRLTPIRSTKVVAELRISAVGTVNHDKEWRMRTLMRMFTGAAVMFFALAQCLTAEVPAHLKHCGVLEATRAPVSICGVALRNICHGCTVAVPRAAFRSHASPTISV